MRRRDLARDALGKALRVRKQLDIPLTSSLSSIDVAEQIGIEVRFVDIPSMEGLYVAGEEPKILLSSLRPLGRRMFTCAHEIGHHIYGHGDQFDEIREANRRYRANTEHEYLADCFAAYLLMPKATVESGMIRRGMSYQSLDPVSVYRLASWLGVGYGTLITHLRYGLGTISRELANRLLRHNAGAIRKGLLDGTNANHLHVVDQEWSGRAIDCEVDDLLLVSQSMYNEGSLLRRRSATLLQAVEPGMERLSTYVGAWSAYVRIAPVAYIGRSCFRFEEKRE